MSSHPIQEAKFNLFVDYFNYFMHCAGLISTMELDNPLSIVEKLIYQIERNPIDKSIVYVKNYYRKLKAWRPYLITYSDFSNAIMEFDKIMKLNGDGPRYKALDQNRTLILNLLHLLFADLKSNMFDRSLRELKKEIHCDHSVEHHIDGIIFHTRIIATAITFIRRSNIDAKSLVNAIFEKDLQKFPYPKELTTIREKEEYFYSINSGTRIDAIRNFYHAPANSWQIIFEIDGLILDKSYIFKYNNVTIYSALNRRGIPLRKLSKEAAKFTSKRREDESRHALCEVSLSTVSLTTAYKNAIIDAQSAIDYINTTLSTSLFFNRGNYFFSNDQINYRLNFTGSIGSVLFIRDSEQKKLEDNAYEFFRKNSSKAQEEFLELENSYLQARKQNSVDKIWQYLEVLNSRRKKPGPKEVISGALLFHEKKFRTQQIDSYLRNAIHHLNSNCSDLGITLDEQLGYLKYRNDLNNLNRKIKSVFFNIAHREMKIRMTKKWIVEQRNYYYSILEETYEQRNFMQHAGKVNVLANTKLENTILTIAVRFRWVIFEYIRKYPNKNLKEILYKIGQDVLTKFGTIQRPYVS